MARSSKAQAVEVDSAQALRNDVRSAEITAAFATSAFQDAYDNLMLAADFVFEDEIEAVAD